jgi:hypothetical protein
MAEVTEKQAAKKEAKIMRKDTKSKSPLPPPPATVVSVWPGDEEYSALLFI